MALKEKLRKRKKKVVKKVSKKASKKKEATPTKSSSKKKVVKKGDKADTPIVKNVKPKVVKGKTDQRTQDITPDWAMDKLNEAKIEVSNRHVNQRHVDLLADDMKKGRWVENGVGIVLDEEGYLIDGQHRLWAVATSGVTIRSLVVTGVNREMALPTINVNQRGRSLADVITMDPPVPGKHISNPRVLQAAVKWLHRYRHKEIFQGNKAVSTGELLELLQAEPGLIDSQHAADSLRGLSPSAGLSVWAHYIFSTRDPDLADEFIDKLATGANLSQTSPILALRHKLIDYKVKKGEKSKSMDHIAFVFFRAWLYFEAGLPLQRLQWRRSATDKRPSESFFYLDGFPKDQAKLRDRLRVRRKKSA
jgi:hypothetical protein